MFYDRLPFRSRLPDNRSAAAAQLKRLGTQLQRAIDSVHSALSQEPRHVSRSEFADAAHLADLDPVYNGVATLGLLELFNRAFSGFDRSQAGEPRQEL